MAVLLLFFCSGATALIYEVLWSKYLGLMFGSTIQAQTVVLAVFMGGLALGNRIFGKRGDILERPLEWYGGMEIVIGLYAFFFPNIYAAADKVFVTLGSNWLENRNLLLALKGVLSVGLLALPTALMGGTLPILASWLKRRENEAGRLSARFYSVNSLGAVAGSACAGFFLVQQLGMSASLQATALLNVLIGFTAIGLGRKMPLNRVVDHGASKGGSAPVSLLERKACLIVTLSGAVSMGLEVLASRSLSLIFGSSLQSFAIVLMAFILGIGIGSAIVASRKAGSLYSQGTIITFLLGASAMIGFFLMTLEQWTVLYSQAKSGLAPSAVGYLYNQLLVAGISLVVLGIPAGLLGSVLPLWIKLVSDAAPDAGRPIGKLLTWNTLGGVFGVLITGFFLMPNLGLRGSIGTLAIILAGCAAYLAVSAGRSRSMVAAMLVLVVLAGNLMWGGEGWRHVLGSGVFRLRSMEITSAVMEQRRKFVKILFYEDAADATVSVETSLKKTNNTELILRINGKPDASTFGDLSTQYLLAHLPILARPQSKDVFVLGFGSGITAGALLGHPLDSVTVAENCEPILRAGRLFDPWNRGALTNKLVRVFKEDARTILKLSNKAYDIIISEPSNPWVAGIGSVFSKEFYELCATRLKDQGLMAQWFHIYEMHDGIVNLVIRTFSSVFPNVEIWDSENGDIIMLGSLRPWNASPETYKAVFDRPIPRADLESIGLKTPETIWARQVASQRTAHAIPGPGGIQSDEFPVLEYEAPKAFFMGKIATDLFVYDERTLQGPLASEAKRKVLSELPDGLLHPIFAQYSSGNSALVEYLKWRARSQTFGGTSNAVYMEAPFFPVIFRNASSYPKQPNVPAGASAQLRKLEEAEAAIFNNPAAGVEAANQIKGIILEASKEPAKEIDWSPAYFGGVAAKELLRQGRVQAAIEVINGGLGLAKDDPQLLYLGRLCEAASK
jgi:spermidine synthase